MKSSPERIPTFAGLIFKLWEESFQPQHLKTGFKKAGLFPLSDPEQVITPTITAPSIPFIQENDDQSTCLNICCRKCGDTFTPIKLHLAVYFSKELQYKPASRCRDKGKTKTSFYGEVLTSDEVMERIESKEREKEEIEAEKSKKKEEQLRQICAREEEKRMKQIEREKMRKERGKRKEEQKQQREERQMKKKEDKEKEKRKKQKHSVITAKSQDDG